MAVSFKTKNDARYSEGSIVSKVPAGVIKKSNDGIERLFVSNPKAIVEELGSAGYSVSDGGIISWSCQDYDYPGQTAWFVGFLAERHR